MAVLELLCAYGFIQFYASLMTQVVKNLPATRETWVRSLGWEDPQRRVSQPTPVVYPGESPWTDELEGYMGSQRVRPD